MKITPEETAREFSSMHHSVKFTSVKESIINYIDITICTFRI
jgi:hypothetical protein